MRGKSDSLAIIAMTRPTLGDNYLVSHLPPGSVVALNIGEYVVGRRGLCMKWEQPIPLSDKWTVTYVGRLPVGVWMTHTERAEVDEEARKEPRA